MNYIDIRSDTVTIPTLEMRQAMFDAVVGDDVSNEDMPSIKLQTTAAGLLNKEMALFVPSGTFANQLSILTHTHPNDNVLIGNDFHVMCVEGGANMAKTVNMITLPNTNGQIQIDVLKEAIHKHKPSLLCLESPHRFGQCLPLSYMKEVYDLAKQMHVKVHLDGARIFNAAIHLQINVKEITQYCDSVMFCLSKNLCAPIGSILAGTKEFMDLARINRKKQGGGWRQSGVIAAPGLVALEKQLPLLSDDHVKAKQLAGLLRDIPQIKIEPTESIHVNMFVFRITAESQKYFVEDEFINFMSGKQIKCGKKIEDHTYRIVVHFYIQNSDLHLISDAFHLFFSKLMHKK